MVKNSIGMTRWIRFGIPYLIALTTAMGGFLLRTEIRLALIEQKVQDGIEHGLILIKGMTSDHRRYDKHLQSFHHRAEKKPNPDQQTGG